MHSTLAEAGFSVERQRNAIRNEWTIYQARAVKLLAHLSLEDSSLKERVAVKSTPTGRSAGEDLARATQPRSRRHGATGYPARR
jgi:hypothetical protein